MTNIQTRHHTVLTHPICFIAFGFGAGLSKYAPGTCGSLVGVLLHYGLLQSLSLFSYSILLLTLTVLGISLCNIAEQKTGIQDDSGIVWDEMCGIWITLWNIPQQNIIWISLGFILFRLFDIWKPWPIRNVERRVKGGFGIMLDDVIAAIYAWGCLHGINELVKIL